MRKRQPRPDEPRQSAQPRQPVGCILPGPLQIALLRRQRPPEAIGGGAVQPLGQEQAMRGPALGTTPRGLGRPARPAAAAIAADPVLHPGLRQPACRLVAECCQIVEPQARLPLGLQPRIGQLRAPDRAGGDHHALPAHRPVPRQHRLAAIGIAHQHRLGQRLGQRRPRPQPRAARQQAVAHRARRPRELFAKRTQGQAGSGHGMEAALATVARLAI